MIFIYFNFIIFNIVNIKLPLQSILYTSIFQRRVLSYHDDLDYGGDGDDGDNDGDGVLWSYLLYYSCKNGV